LVVEALICIPTEDGMGTSDEQHTYTYDEALFHELGHLHAHSKNLPYGEDYIINNYENIYGSYERGGYYDASIWWR